MKRIVICVAAMLETRLAARRLLLRQFRNFSARSLKELGETEPVGHLREIGRASCRERV